ncbi:MAG: hypothetical protein EBZ49_15550 [Proteobacteria bacterium]|nr:hypothetical protein [Pseudomonadota bacterium]
MSGLLNRPYLDDFIKDSSRNRYELLLVLLLLSFALWQAAVLPVFIAPMLVVLCLKITGVELYRLRRMSRRNFF